MPGLTLLQNEHRLWKGNKLAPEKLIDGFWKNEVYPVIGELKAAKSPDLPALLLSQIGFYWEVLFRSRSSIPLVDPYFGQCFSILGVGTADCSDRSISSKCCLVIGDMCRYLQDTRNSLNFYGLSSFLNPTASAYNQIAVVLHQQNSTPLAVHYYLRALLHPQPFTAARDNLVRSLDSYDPGIFHLDIIGPALFGYLQSGVIVHLLNCLGLIQLFPRNHSYNLWIQSFNSLLQTALKSDEALDRTYGYLIMCLHSISTIVDSQCKSVVQQQLTGLSKPLFMLSKHVYEDLSSFSIFSELLSNATLGPTNTEQTLESFLISTYEMPTQNADEDIVTFTKFRKTAAGVPKTVGHGRHSQSPSFQDSHGREKEYSLFPPARPSCSEISPNDEMVKLARLFQLKPE